MAYTKRFSFYSWTVFLFLTTTTARPFNTLLQQQPLSSSSSSSSSYWLQKEREKETLQQFIEPSYSDMIFGFTKRLVEDSKQPKTTATYLQQKFLQDRVHSSSIYENNLKQNNLELLSSLDDMLFIDEQFLLQNDTEIPSPSPTVSPTSSPTPLPTPFPTARITSSPTQFVTTTPNEQDNEETDEFWLIVGSLLGLGILILVLVLVYGKILNDAEKETVSSSSNDKGGKGKKQTFAAQRNNSKMSNFRSSMSSIFSRERLSTWSGRYSGKLEALPGKDENISNYIRDQRHVTNVVIGPRTSKPKDKKKDIIDTNGGSSSNRYNVPNKKKRNNKGNSANWENSSLKEMNKDLLDVEEGSKNIFVEQNEESVVGVHKKKISIPDLESNGVSELL